MSRPELILEPSYWAKRLREAPPDAPHHAVFRCPLERWRAIEAKHREILARAIGPADSVLDAGCGWGRLLELMPDGWKANKWAPYFGVDLSPEFIALGRQRHRDFLNDATRLMLVADLRCLPFDATVGPFDWAVLVSIRPMIRRNCGEEVWAQVERELRRVARRLLFLEYDEADGGSVE